MDIEKLIDDAATILHRRGKISYSALKLGLSIDDEIMSAIRDELVDVLEIAEDRDGKYLVLVQTAAVPETPHDAKPKSNVSVLGDDLELAERRVLTVMFCDLVGSTKLSHELDSEDLRDVFSRYQQASARAIAETDGYIAQYLGDGILAYFGYPRVHESDALRAIKAAIGILENIKALNDSLQNEYNVELQVRISLHSGEVVIGDIGGDKRKETLALGEVPNVAARLQSLASPNEIIISESTRQLLGNRIEATEMGEQTLQGVRNSLKTYRIVNIKDQSWPTSQGSNQFIGRDHELEVLTGTWDNIQTEGGAAVFVRGEAGIGKSTLLRQFVKNTSIASDQIWFLKGQDETQLSSLRPATTGITAKWNLSNADSDKFAKIEEHMSGFSNEEIISVAEVLGAEIPATIPTTPSTPQIHRQRMLNALARVLTSSGDQKPRIIFLEDLHWYDPTSLELVNILIESIKTTSAMIIMTARMEYEPDWRLDNVHDLKISRLSHEETVALIKFLSKTSKLPDELVSRLSSRAQGVPLFIEELTKTVFESDAVKVDENGIITIIGELDDEVIPVSIYGCLMTRLDQMHTARQIAQLGAVIGIRFSYELVRAASELDDDTLTRSLNELVQSGLMSKIDLNGQTIYEYSHAILRDAIEQSLLKSTRRVLHGNIADTLTKHFPDTESNEPETIAFHLTMATRGAEALRYWKQAGMMALGRFANAEANNYFSRGLKAVTQLPDKNLRTVEELGLTVLKAVSMMSIRGWATPEVRECYLHARQLLDQLDAQASPELFPTLVGLASYFIVTGNWSEARQLVKQNLSHAEKIGNDKLILEAVAEKIVVEAYSGNPEIVDSLFEKVSSLYDPATYADHLILFGRNAMAAAYTCKSINSWIMGHADRAIEEALNGIEEVRRLYHPFSLAWSQSPVTWVYLFRGEPEKALVYIDELCIFSQEHGFPFWLGQGFVAQGWASLLLGNSDQAMEKIMQGLAIWNASGTKMLQPMMKWPLIKTHLMQGNANAGLEEARSVLEYIEDSEEIFFAPEILILQGEALEMTDGSDSAAAFDSYQKAYDLACRKNAFTLKLHAATKMAELLANRGKYSDGFTILSPLIHDDVEGYDTFIPSEARRVLAQLAANK